MSQIRKLKWGRSAHKFFSRRFGKKHDIITGCLGTTTAIRQLKISISSSGNRLYRSYKVAAKRSAVS